MKSKSLIWVVAGVILLCLFTSIVSATPGWKFHADAENTGVYDDGGIAPTNNVMWTFPTGWYVTTTPAIVNGVVYVGSDDSKVYAIDANTGAEVWNFPTGGRVFSSPAVANGMVYFGSEDWKFYAINANTGAKVWDFPTIGSTSDSSPVVVNGVVYAGGGLGNFYAIDANTGSQIWNFNTGTGAWFTSPAVANGVVYVGHLYNKVYAIDANDGHKIWEFTTGDSVYSSPAVANGMVYIGSWDKKVYAIDAITGAEVWSFTTGSLVRSTPAIANGVVYVGSDDSKVYALNANTGAEIWRFTTGQAVMSSPAVANGVVYVGSYDSKVYALNANTGAEIWRFTTGSYVKSSPAVANGVVYVGSFDGNVYALGGTPAPTVGSINPNAGVNTSSVSITDLAGTGFATGVTVKLTKTGQADIAATNVWRVSATKLTCDLPITGAVAGTWDVVVTNPDAQTGTLANGFTVKGPAPTVTSINPNTGVNTGSVSITNLAGTGFEAIGATVMLTPVNPNPVHTGSLADGGGVAPFLNGPYGVYVSGNYAYVVSTTSDSLEIIDISNPAAPVHTGSIVDGAGTVPFLDWPHDVYVSGNYAYVASELSNALEIIDVSNPAAPVHTGSIVDGGGVAPFLAHPYDVYVSGNYAYVASYALDFGEISALEIIDVSNPAAPHHEGSIVNGEGGALLYNPDSVFVSGNYAYVTSYGQDALEIVDVTNPAAPHHEGSIANFGPPFLNSPVDVYVSGNYAYVVSYDDNALEIIDVTNPAAPHHEGSIRNGEFGARLYIPRSVSVSGNYAYVVSSGSNALEIVDVSNPVAPMHKGSIVSGDWGVPPFLKYPLGVYVCGTYAYVASYSNNALEIVDIGTVMANGVSVLSPTKITNTFDLTNKVAGPYNVVVTNPDGQFGTLPSGFTVSAPAPAITQEQAVTIAREKAGSTAGKGVSVSQNSVSPGTIVQTMRGSSTSPDCPSWLVSIDHKRKANLEHEFTNYYVCDEDVVSSEEVWSPPLNIGMTNDLNGNPDLPDLRPAPTGSSTCSYVTCENCYALLISGGYNPENNHIRYWNDMSSMYKTLRQKYCYPEDHIYVLMSDGTSDAPDRRDVNPTTGLPVYDSSPLDLDGKDRAVDVHGEAIKTNIVETLTNPLELGKLTAADTLFIFTTNHGGKDPYSSNVRLWLWQGDYIWDYEFADLLNNVQANTIAITMEQCYSGGFIDDFTTSVPPTQTRVIATAASADEPSYGNDFSYHWISGVGGPADTEGNNDGLISLSESFIYGKTHDPSFIDNLEHPDYKDMAKDTGLTLGLSSCSKINCPPPSPLLGYQYAPTDPNTDGIYEDLNGDGTFNFLDVVLYFNQIEWISDLVNNEPVCAFDANRNGRIDFADIVKLYGKLPVGGP